MSRDLKIHEFKNTQSLSLAGLTPEGLLSGVKYTYNILDSIDNELASSGELPLSNMIELANLSSMIGNLLASGISKYSNGYHTKNKPHQYPDLLKNHPKSSNIEIKIALETNKPKGHLAKAGYYLIFRYILCDRNLNYTLRTRDTKVSIWEIRFGYLENDHFNLSNTAGDSGKTAVINAHGMEQLKIIYCDLKKCPYTPNGTVYKKYQKLYQPPHH